MMRFDRMTLGKQQKGERKMKKKINSFIYTFGKFGKGWREILDTDNPNLYSHGRYPTKITADDLPKDYLKIHSRVIWYMTGFIKTSGVKDIKYRWTKVNHLFKDDYIYLSYHGAISKKVDDYGFEDYADYDVRVCGNDIIDIVLWVEKYSGIDTTEVREEIEKKRVWLRDNKKEYYNDFVGEDKDIFELWLEKGYVTKP